jgi:hypothetical protein
LVCVHSGLVLACSPLWLRSREESMCWWTSGSKR